MSLEGAYEGSSLSIATEVRRIEERLAAVADSLDKDFPAYSELSHPKPIAIGATQALLKPNEALVMYLDLPQSGRWPEETLVRMVTKTDARWFTASLTPGEIADNVHALRCGLDPARWKGGDGQDMCVALVKAHPPQVEVDGKVVDFLPFDLDRAHALYKALLGPFEASVLFDCLGCASRGMGPWNLSRVWTAAEGFDLRSRSRY